jgi:hypothetical protein
MSSRASSRRSRWTIAAAALLLATVLAIPALAAPSETGTATCAGGDSGFTTGEATNWQEHTWDGSSHLFTYDGHEFRTRNWGPQLAGTYAWKIEGPELSFASGNCFSR